MASLISILSENLTNKIAAGEVVERPASVAKELVENSIDAGAAHIVVEAAAGGRRLIRVCDDGSGMSQEDALLSLERHATSKIRSDTDLDSISTMGFRGEALPSIASVSRFSMRTRSHDAPEGTELSVEGGRVREVKACGMPHGTDIRVENLFFNTPARLKFLKSPETESGHLGDLMCRMALSRPEIGFTYSSDGREVFRAPPSDLPSRVATVIGRKSASDLYPVHAGDGNISISGLLSGPSSARSSTSHLFLYVNGRFVRDKVVQHAVMQAYRNVLEKGRYPLVILFVELPSGDVDVNVHPTKHEVRFRRQSSVHDAIMEAVAGVLRASPWLRTPLPAQKILQPASAKNHDIATGVSRAIQGYLDSAPHAQKLSPAGYPAAAGREFSVRECEPEFPKSCSPDTQSGTFSTLRPLGQFHGEYLLCEGDAELLIIDQHAASERIAFECLKRDFSTRRVESQTMLMPEVLDLSHAERASMRRYSSELEKMGFEVEEFGGGSVAVKAFPAIVPPAAVTGLLRDILAEMSETGSKTGFDEIRDLILSRIACHSVMRGPKRLMEQETRELLAGMDRTDFAGSCPHGRPVLHRISLKELEKIFRRV